jgi:hypothetical protein
MGCCSSAPSDGVSKRESRRQSQRRAKEDKLLAEARKADDLIRQASHKHHRPRKSSSSIDDFMGTVRGVACMHTCVHAQV